VSADDGATNFGGLFQTAAQNCGNSFRWNEIDWEAYEVQSGDRATAHGENIRERISGRDLSVSERVIHDGREKIHGLNKRTMSIQFVNAGVIERARVNENVSISISW